MPSSPAAKAPYYPWDSVSRSRTASGIIAGQVAGPERPTPWLPGQPNRAFSSARAWAPAPEADGGAAQ
jgi:hypothetical protein